MAVSDVRDYLLCVENDKAAASRIAEKTTQSVSKNSAPWNITRLLLFRIAVTRKYTPGCRSVSRRIYQRRRFKDSRPSGVIPYSGTFVITSKVPLPPATRCSLSIFQRPNRRWRSDRGTYQAAEFGQIHQRNGPNGSKSVSACPLQSDDKFFGLHSRASD
jgi:hypothetical protein